VDRVAILTWSRVGVGSSSGQDGVSGSSILETMHKETSKGCIFAKPGAVNPHSRAARPHTPRLRSPGPQFSGSDDLDGADEDLGRAPLVRSTSKQLDGVDAIAEQSTTCGNGTDRGKAVVHPRRSVGFSMSSKCMGDDSMSVGDAGLGEGAASVLDRFDVERKAKLGSKKGSSRVQPTHTHASTTPRSLSGAEEPTGLVTGDEGSRDDDAGAEGSTVHRKSSVASSSVSKGSAVVFHKAIEQDSKVRAAWTAGRGFRVPSWSLF
jgi:hypothetical protein